MRIGSERGARRRTLEVVGAALLLAAVECGAGVAHAEDCLVTIRVPDSAPDPDVPLDALQFDVDYAQADGAFLGQGQTTDCSFALPLVNGVAAAFNNKPGDRVLTAAVIGLRAFDAPYGIIHCRFDYVTSPPTADEFEITVVDATNIWFLPVVPTPTVVVSAIQCPFAVATTTTLPPPLCGQPVSQAGPPTAADALAILYAGIGLEPCDEPCQCDVDGSGVISARDALFVLNAVVGLGASLDCPTC
jgi:hypothetical protein